MANGKETVKMPYVQMPRDLNKIKEKFLFGLPKRQVLWFGMGIAIGAVPFFVLVNYDVTAAVVALMCSILPFGFVGMYEKNGQTFDKIITLWLRANLFRPKIRPYKTENIYVDIEKQLFLNEEVKRIGYKGSFKNKLVEALEGSGKKKKRKLR